MRVISLAPLTSGVWLAFFKSLFSPDIQRVLDRFRDGVCLGSVRSATAKRLVGGRGRIAPRVSPGIFRTLLINFL